MSTRSFSLIDRALGEIDKAIKVLAAPRHASRPVPAALDEAPLSEAQRAESARLMRVNHSGEVAAQALYQGQALTAGDPAVSAALQHAASEEADHLAWCESRIRELNGRTSLLNPLWYVGSFAIGAVAVSLISTAYLAEIVRAGLASVHANQWHSAAVANFSLWQTLRLVVVPQAWPVILPPAFGFFVMFLKDTALASQIGVVELTYAGKTLNNRGFAPLLTFGAVLILYFAMSYPLTLLGRRLEARFARPRHR